MRGLLEKKATWAMVVFLAVSLLYWPCRNFSFVRLDDQEYVYQNGHIRDGLSFRCIGWAFRDVGYASNWHPLTWMSHALDVSIARAMGMEVDSPGRLPGAWTAEDGALAHLSHLHNLILHAVNASLLFWLLSIMAGMKDAGQEPVAVPPLGCALLALLWAAHPLRGEVVAWVSERKELLSVLFMLLALIAYSGRGACRYLMALLCFMFALLAKPVAVSLPAVMLSWEFVLRRETAKKCILRALPFSMLAAAVCVLTLFAQDDAMKVGKVAMSWTTRIVNAVEAPAVYLRQTVWPAGLCALYVTQRSVRWAYFAGGMALLCAMVWAVAYWVRRRGVWSGIAVFSVFWCYVGLIPMLGIVKVGGQPHSDRYTYWIGCGMVAVGAMVWSRSMGWLARAGYVRGLVWTMVVLVGIYGVSAAIRSGAWRDSLALYADVVKKTADEDSAMILADEMSRQGRRGRKEAVTMLRGVLAERRTAKARGGLALFLAMHGGSEDGRDILAEARMFAHDAIAEDPKCSEAYAALGFADMHEGDLQGAASYMERAFANGYTNSRVAALLPKWKRTAKP